MVTDETFQLYRGNDEKLFTVSHTPQSTRAKKHAILTLLYFIQFVAYLHASYKIVIIIKPIKLIFYLL